MRQGSLVSHHSLCDLGTVQTAESSNSFTCGVGAAQVIDHAHALLCKLLLQLALPAAALRPLQLLLLVTALQDLVPIRQPLTTISRIVSQGTPTSAF